MSTIASPRDTSLPGRRPAPQPQITPTTPTTSSRPSLDNTTSSPRSTSASPSRGPPGPAAPAQPRRNRAALREYYNLKREESKGGATDDAEGSEYSLNDAHASDVADSELDSEGFDAEGYVRRVLETQSLEELLATYGQVLSDIRALDAEKKALVYDNYSKLIAATDTIRRMRANMDPLNPMAATLSPAIGQIYELVEVVKGELRAEMMAGGSRVGERKGGEEERKKAERVRAREVARRVLEVPERLRMLVAEGKIEEAREEWEGPLALLRRWKDEGKGGDDVQDCIEDGEAALRGEPPGEKSWVNLRSID